MLNKSGITTTTAAAPTQILAEVGLQYSVGCIVASTLQATANDGTRKIVKAGTPIKIDLSNLQTPAAAPTTNPASASGATTSDMNAVLLHDVDVTNGNANGTALLFGFVNINRVDSTTAAKLKAGTFGGVTFLKA